MPLQAPKGFIPENDPRVSQIGHPAPPWLVNYADLMTELVCFFIILYALSAALNKNVVNAAEQIKKMMQSGQLNGSVSIDREGLKITLEEKGQMSFFKSGSADTTTEMEGMIAKLAPTLQKLSADHDIVVEGYTDNQPIHNEYYDSNWELSTARATSVARLLADHYHIAPQHMAAEGYGEYRPVAPNDSPEHRAKNRRVVFLVKTSSYKAFAPAVAPSAGAAATAPSAEASTSPEPGTQAPDQSPPEPASP